MEVSINPYGDYSSSNYGVHSLKVTIGRLNLWFSYKTIVAFEYDGRLSIIKNYWSTTSGKHLNWIDRDKKVRLESLEFNRLLDDLLRKLDLTFD